VRSRQGGRRNEITFTGGDVQRETTDLQLKSSRRDRAKNNKMKGGKEKRRGSWVRGRVRGGRGGRNGTITGNLYRGGQLRPGEDRLKHWGEWHTWKGGGQWGESTKAGSKTQGGGGEKILGEKTGLRKVRWLWGVQLGLLALSGGGGGR